MNKDQFTRFLTARQVAGSVTKFHGNPLKDDDRTVDEFVQLVNSQMDTWLGKDQQHGRLNLVIGRTEGTAQNWLARKREEMEKLLAAGTVTEKLLTEWSEVQSDFKAKRPQETASD